MIWALLAVVQMLQTQTKADIHAGWYLHKQFVFSSSQSQTGHFKCFEINDLKHSFLEANQCSQYNFWQYSEIRYGSVMSSDGSFLK